MSVKARLPVKVKVNWWNWCKLLIFWLLCIVLTIILIGVSANILAYYIYSVLTYGWFHAESLKYAIYLVIGAYAFLIIDRKKIDEALGIKRDLPFITVEQINSKVRKKKQR